MAKSKISKVFLLSLIIGLVALPFYLLWDYFVLGYKFLSPDYSKIRSGNGVTSVLVLGKGGEGHTAPDLTDTIINIFVSQKSSKVSLLPVPRDIWIPEIRAKINSAYYWDKQRQNSNFELVSSSLKGIVGVDVDYIIVVDFSMFVDLVDSLGGIDIEVENSFIDEKFPILGKESDQCGGDKTFACRYETISFEKGIQTMDGETALKFVRSRNAQDNEGTDLAREKRQQKVIDALKSEIFSPKLITNPGMAFSVLNSVLLNVETNLDVESVIVLARIIFNSKDNINPLSFPEEDLVVSKGLPKYDYQYVFLPKGGSWNAFSTNLQNQIY